MGGAGFAPAPRGHEPASWLLLYPPPCHWRESRPYLPLKKWIFLPLNYRGKLPTGNKTFIQFLWGRTPTITEKQVTINKIITPITGGSWIRTSTSGAWTPRVDSYSTPPCHWRESRPYLPLKKMDIFTIKLQRQITYR